MPFTTRVNGVDTEIVGYGYTASGTPEPEVGNDWYPIVIDSYTTAEYESLDAYLASEYGQIFLSSCGVSALVPLATAIQRLADNDINITVHDRQGAYRRYVAGNGALVDSDGKCVIWKVPGDTDYVVLATATANQFTLSPKTGSSSTAVIAAFGEGTMISTEPAVGIREVISGTTYTITSTEGEIITLNPTPANW